MAELKRDPVKYIRDRVKSNYKKDCECRICGTSSLLELHHFNSVAEMFNKWEKEKDLLVNSVDDIIDVRDTFIEEHWDELVHQCVTLCKKHHALLHKIYGKNPKLSTASKQANWVEKQRAKRIGGD